MIIIGGKMTKPLPTNCPHILRVHPYPSPTIITVFIWLFNKVKQGGEAS